MLWASRQPELAFQLAEVTFVPQLSLLLDSEDSDSGDSWVMDVGDAEWTEAAQSDLTREMNAAPARFAQWQPDNPFMAAIKRAIVSATTGSIHTE
jgi:hypothetical protein